MARTRRLKSNSYGDLLIEKKKSLFLQEILKFICLKSLLHASWVIDLSELIRCKTQPNLTAKALGSSYVSVSVSDAWLNEYENGRLTDNMD